MALFCKHFRQVYIQPRGFALQGLSLRGFAQRLILGCFFLPPCWTLPIALAGAGGIQVKAQRLVGFQQREAGGRAAQFRKLLVRARLQARALLAHRCQIGSQVRGIEGCGRSRRL